MMSMGALDSYADFVFLRARCCFTSSQARDDLYEYPNVHTNAYILFETRHICPSELVGAPFGTSRTWDENEVART